MEGNAGRTYTGAWRIKLRKRKLFVINGYSINDLNQLTNGYTANIKGSTQR